MIGTDLATLDKDTVPRCGGLIVRTRPGFTVYIDNKLAPSGTPMVIPARDLRFYGPEGPWRCIEDVNNPLPVDAAADAAAKARYGDVFSFKRWVPCSSEIEQYAGEVGPPKHGIVS